MNHQSAPSRASVSAFQHPTSVIPAISSNKFYVVAYQNDTLASGLHRLLDKRNMQIHKRLRLASFSTLALLVLLPWTQSAGQQQTFESVVTKERSLFHGFVSVGTGNDLVKTNTAVGYQPLWENSGGTYNTAIGYHTLRINSSGRVNTAIGVQSLLRNTTGSYNLAIGVEALANNDSGVNNTAVGGYDTLLNNTTGSGNTALGYAALYSNTTADGNTGLGHDALYFNTSGIFNTAVGRRAGEFNDTGSFNIYVGFQAGASNTAGSNNTYVGDHAGFFHTGSNNILIGPYAQGLALDGDNQLSLGNIILGDLSTGTVLIASREDNGVDKLQVGGSVAATQFKLAELNAPPATSSDPCTTGEIRVAADFVYVCVGTDLWRRSALMDF